MAKAKQETADPAVIEARALVDLPEHGAKAGALIAADPAVIEALAALGSVDPHPDAVAYAKTLEA